MIWRCGVIQVIKRFHRIILAVARSGGRGCPMGHLAAMLEISVPACSNIVRTMVELGYLRQLGPKLGYVLGDTPYFIARNGAFRQDLIAVTRPYITRLSEETNELVVLVVEHERKRCELMRMESSNHIRINPPESLENLMMSPTGCVILSDKSREERKEYWDEYEGENCLSLTDFAGFDNECDKIRFEGICILWPQEKDSLKRIQGVVSMAAPIRQGNVVTGSLGMIIPMMRFSTEVEQNVVIGALVDTCSEITSKLDSGEI